MGEGQPSFVAYALTPESGGERIEGRLLCDRWRLRFDSDSMSFELPLGQLEIEQGDAKGGQIIFSHPEYPGWSLYTFDERVLQLPVFLQQTDTRRQIEAIRSQGELKRRLTITGVVFGSVVLVTLMISILTGVMVRSLVARIPPEWEQQVGDDGMAELKQTETFVEDPKQLAQLNQTIDPLLKVVPSKVAFKSYILDDQVPNAFALPGGHVIVTTGLLHLAGRPEEVAAAVAHELAHVTQKHGFRQVISSAGPFLLFRLFLGGEGLAGLIGRSSELMVSQSFSQDYEYEADSVGWDYLVAARIDPRNLVEILRKLQATETEEEKSQIRAFSSHPKTDKRINRLQAKWAKLKNKSGFIQIPVQLNQ